MRKFLRLTAAVLVVLSLLSIPFLAQAAQVHRVAGGENLYVIAGNYGVTVNEIVSKNYLRNPDRIFTGQVLIIPEADKPGIYRVKSGDTLYKVSQQFGISMAVLADANNITDWDYLYVGQVLTIPESGSKQSEQPVGGSAGLSLAQLFAGTLYRKGASDTNRIAITFDDGPDLVYTPQVLDVLKEYKVPATFFIMGSRSARHPEIVERMIEESHVIGNHSWSHPNLTRISEDELVEEMQRTENVLERITGLRTRLMRPPYGAISKDVLEALEDMDYKVVNWSVDSVDWRDKDVDKILINTLPDVREEAIILFHSASGEGNSLSATVEALPELIQTLRMQGYTFVTIDELLDIPAYR